MRSLTITRTGLIQLLRLLLPVAFIPQNLQSKSGERSNPLSSSSFPPSGSFPSLPFLSSALFPVSLFSVFPFSMLYPLFPLRVDCAMENRGKLWFAPLTKLSHILPGVGIKAPGWCCCVCYWCGCRLPRIAWNP